MAEMKGGFYYDLQKNNKFTSVTLHSNMVYDVENKTFRKPSNSIAEETVDDEGYVIKPLCSSIVNEDFSVAVANSWTEAGGDPIGSLWNSLKPLAPYTGFLGDAISMMKSKQEGLENNNTVRDSYLARGLTKLVNILSDKTNMQKANEYLNSSLVVQGTRFSFFSGSGVSFSNMNMKFTLFSEMGSSVIDKLMSIIPFSMGHFEDVTPELFEENGLDNFIGFEKPPGGYRANIRYVDNGVNEGMEGTLKLKIGSYYSIRNLVIHDIQLSFSKNLVKLVSADDIGSSSSTITKFSLVPLFCDVQITLKPAIKFTDNMLDHFVFGNSTKEDRDRLSQDLESSLSEKSKKLNK